MSFVWQTRAICVSLVEDFWLIISNLDQWFIRCLKDFLSRAVAALLFDVRVELLCHFDKGHYGEQSCEVIFNFY